MWHQPCILPAIALAVIIGTVGRCKRAIFLAEPAVAVLASYETKLMVKQVDI